jgi:Subtilase family
VVIFLIDRSRPTLRVVLVGLIVLGSCAWSWSKPPDGPVPRSSPARLADVKGIRERLGLSPTYDKVAGIESVKIAVLDYGFDGLGQGKGYLPDSAELVENYDPDFVRKFNLGDPEFKKPFEPLNRHGREMAQIVWSITGSKPGGPKFYLLNANGPTMLRRAVRYAIEQHVDIILFSGAFEGGGSGDGKGPIDRIVEDATVRGIIWVNASGNYGGRVYNGPVKVLSDGYLKLRNVPDIAALRFRNRADENTLTITLTWNDYKDEEDAGTSKDLDLFVEDWTGRTIGSSQKIQVTGEIAATPDQSRNPRERVVLTNLPANPHVPTDPDICYRIRVKARTGKFTTGDQIRILLTATRDSYVPAGALGPEDAVTFVDASNQGELYPPADQRGVLTVGEGGPSSSVGPTLDGRPKPDVIVEDSRAYFSDGQMTYGSSNAAAFLAGVAVVLKAAEPGLYGNHLLELARECPAQKEDPAVKNRTGTARPTSPPRPVLRTWKSPTKARLTAVVRGGI